MRARVLGSAAGGGFPQWNCACDELRARARGRRRASRRARRTRSPSAATRRAVAARQRVAGRPPADRAVRGASPAGRAHTPIGGHRADQRRSRSRARPVLAARVAAARGPRDRARCARARRAQRDAPHARAHGRPGDVDAASSSGARSCSTTSGVGVTRGRRRRASCRCTSSGCIEPSPEDNVALRIRDLASGRVAGRRDRRRRARRASTRSSRGPTRCFFDGTFWSEDELVAQRPGQRARARHGARRRSAATAAASRALARVARAPRRVYTHINNTNPILAQDSPERAARRARRLGGRLRRPGDRAVTRRRARSRRRVRRAAPRRGRAALPRPPPVPRAHARGRALARAAPALGAEPLLLPDAHPHQGRAHPLEERRPGVPPRVDPPHRTTTTGRRKGEGGLAEWLRLARGRRARRGRGALVPRGCCPAVRFACDAYVELVRERPLVEAVASSLTEHFAPDIMRTRIAAWEKHYPWVDAAALAYFRARVPARDARRRGGARLRRAATRRRASSQEACVRALVDKCTHPLGDARRHRRGARREAPPVAQGAGAARPARRHARAPLPRAGAAPERDAPPRSSPSATARATVDEIVGELRASLRGRRRARGSRRDVRGAPRGPARAGRSSRRSREPRRRRSTGERSALRAPARALDAPRPRRRPYTLVAELTHRCPLACPYCSNPRELVARQRRARDRRVAARRRRGRGARRDAGAPHRRRAAGALRSRGHRGAGARARSLREPRHERRAARPRAARAARAVRSTTCSSASRTPTRRASDRIAGSPSFEQKMRVARVGQGARAAAHAQRRPAPRQPRSRRGRSSRSPSASGPTGWSSRTCSSCPGRSRTGARSCRRAAQIERARAVAAEAKRAARRGRWRSSSSCRTGTPTGRARAWTAGGGASSSSRPTAPCCPATRRARCRSRSRACAARRSARIWTRGRRACDAFRGEAWMPEPCRSCDRRGIDFGGCRCQAFALTGDAGATDPACSLSPAHDLVRAARASAERPAEPRKLIFRGR